MVLYGGVSLAVYIYGVVIEAQRLLRAGEELARAREGVFTPEQLSPYGRALFEADVEGVAIDLLSGTSAGGINGILLAKALARGTDVESTKALWLDGGDIEQLLQPPSVADPRSLLQSRSFEARLREGMRMLDTGAQPGYKRPAILDLFVSATHLRGGQRIFVDSLADEIATRQHRYVFQRKLRTPQKGLEGEEQSYPADEFKDNEVLVKLARATSAFPVAFEPIEITAADGLLEVGESDGWFADGGILNNKPFTEAVETIASRSSDRPVRRWLFSIDPDPDPPAEEDGSAGKMPSFDQVAIRSIAVIPRYQSIVRDLLALDEHNEKVAAVERAIYEGEAELALPDQAEAAGQLGPGVAAAFEAMRRQAWGLEVADRLLDATVVPESQGLDTTGVHREFRFAAEAALPAEEADGAMYRRRLYYLIKLIAMARNASDEEAAAKEALWAEYEALSLLLWERLTSEPLELDPNDQRGSAAQLGATRINAAIEALPGAIQDSETRLQERLEGVEVYIAPRGPLPPEPAISPAPQAAPVAVSLAAAAVQFRPRDAMLLAADLYGGLRQRDRIDHAQISPATGKNTKVPATSKLAGVTLGHFGGFLDRGWRRNDIMWGRLDGAETFLRAVLQEAPPAHAKALVDAVQQEILAIEQPQLLTEPGDWKDNLHRHACGDVSDGELNGRRLVSLGLRAAAVVRKMLRTAAGDAAEGGVIGRVRAFLLRSAANALGFALALVYLPATALFAKGQLVKRTVIFLALVPLLWGVLTLALAILGVVPFDEVVLPALAGIAVYPLFLLLYWGLAVLAQKAERTFRGPRR